MPHLEYDPLNAGASRLCIQQVLSLQASGTADWGGEVSGVSFGGEARRRVVEWGGRKRSGPGSGGGHGWGWSKKTV